MKRRNDVQVAAVYRTEELDSFKFMIGNRPPNPMHVRKILKSIQEHGMKMIPIIVNEFFEVIDGQHRLLAAKQANCEVYYMIYPNARLSDVHIMNANQKNWTTYEYMHGYADMGIIPYIKMREFYNRNSDFNITNCIAFCSNLSNAAAVLKSNKTRSCGKDVKIKEVFEDGTWRGKDFVKAQNWADKIRSLKKYYLKYNNNHFVGTMITLFNYPEFDFNHFYHKLSVQPTALIDCANRRQYKELIEDIYNYKSREKVSFKYI